MLFDSGCDLNHLEEGSPMIGSTAITRNIKAISFINYVIQVGGRGGVSQKMTQDDRGRGGGLGKDDR